MTGPERGLDRATNERILGVCAEGDRHAEAGRHGSALGKFAEAWGLIPHPRERWAVATPVVSAIDDPKYLAFLSVRLKGELWTP